MAGHETDLQQRIIDHQARLGWAQASVADVRAARQARTDGRGTLAEARWFREQYIQMIRSARSEQELYDLGLTDELVRDARLGSSLLAAWKHYHAGGYPRW